MLCKLFGKKVILGDDEFRYYESVEYGYGIFCIGVEAALEKLEHGMAEEALEILQRTWNEAVKN